MKKLMIAAAAVAMASVAMAECTETLKPCPFAYRIKLAGKTVVAQATASISNAVTCVDGNCWAKPASLRIAGYFYGEQDPGAGTCGESACACMTLDKYTENSVFWDASKKEVVFTPEFEVFEVLRNGGALNKAQILLKLGDLNLAGFGVYNPVTGRLKSANGFFAGKLAAPECDNSATCDDPVPAKVFTLCGIYDDTGALNPVGATAAIAYGRWNLAWKQDKVNLAMQPNADWDKIVKPAAFVSANPNPGE